MISRTGSPNVRHWILVFSLVLGLCLCLVPGAVQAVAFHPLQALDPPQPDDEIPPPEDEPEAPQNGVMGTILHTIGISSSSLYDVWLKVLNRSADSFSGELSDEFAQAADLQARLFASYSRKGLDGVMVAEESPAGYSSGEAWLQGGTRSIWQDIFNVAMLFFPLVILVNTGGVLTSGVTAPVARAEMLEGLVKACITIALAAGSFLIGSHLVKIGWGLAEMLKPADMSATWIRSWIPAGIGSAAMVLGSSPTNPVSIFGIFLLFLTVTLNLVLFGALILSHYAIIVITITLLCIAPLVIVLGNFKPFAWLYWTWSKAFASILLVPALNAILMRLWSGVGLMVQKNASGSIFAYLVSLGFMGLLVAVNFTVGKLAYQPALEAARKAFESTRQVVGAAIRITSAIGLAASGAGTAGAPALGRGGTSPSAAEGLPGLPAGLNPGSSEPGGQVPTSNPYLNLSPQQRSTALQSNQVRAERLSTFNRSSGILLRGHPEVQAASQMFFGAQNERLLEERHQIEQAQEILGDQRGWRTPHLPGRGQNASGSSMTYDRDPGSSSQVWGALWGRDGAMDGVYSDRTRQHAAWRSRAVNSVGQQAARWQAEDPHFFDPLKNMAVSREQFLAALAFRSAEDYFQPLMPNRSTTVMYNRDADHILETISKMVPGTSIGRVASAARAVPPEEPSSRTGDPVGLFFDHLNTILGGKQDAAK